MAKSLSHECLSHENEVLPPVPRESILVPDVINAIAFTVGKTVDQLLHDPLINAQKAKVNEVMSLFYAPESSEPPEPFLLKFNFSQIDVLCVFPDGDTCKWATVYLESEEEAERYRSFCNGYFTPDPLVPDCWTHLSGVFFILFYDEEAGCFVMGVTGIDDITMFQLYNIPPNDVCDPKDAVLN